MSPRWLTVHQIARQAIDNNRRMSKADLAQHVARHFDLRKARSVYYSDDFAIRFAHASGDSFSNCVVSLAVIKEFDSVPFLVCVRRRDRVETLLANATLIKKVSHSSHQLSMTNIRGTILGHDIMRDLNGVANVPQNFANLYAAHVAASWGDNLGRIVAATNSIAATGETFTPSPETKQRIMASAALASRIVTEQLFVRATTEMDQVVESCKPELLEAAAIDNGNLRGNRIEQILTRGTNLHGCDDVIFELAGGIRLLVDIKSKLLDRSSSPKLYNVDKLLAELGRGDTAMSLYFIGLEVSSQNVITRLVSIFDRTILGATRLQFHWAGRGSRGVTQLGDISSIFRSSFQECVDVDSAQRFLTQLLDS